MRGLGVTLGGPRFTVEGLGFSVERVEKLGWCSISLGESSCHLGVSKSSRVQREFVRIIRFSNKDPP